MSPLKSGHLKVLEGINFRGLFGEPYKKLTNDKYVPLFMQESYKYKSKETNSIYHESRNNSR